ncbi:MAG: methyl-accepting chemotaxis protein [Synergistaceae bacterium]|jgi:methyl-accepting chemotaxis protein|nr:methyl-accepting chemotaxis protein [Synergistaceae bacterium]
MSWLRNRSIGGKLGILAAIPLVLLIGITVFNFVALGRVDVRYTFAYENFSAYSTELMIVRANVRAIQEDIAKIIILHGGSGEIKRLREDIAERRSENNGVMERYRNSLLTEEEKPLLAQVDKLLPKMREIQDDLIERASEAASDPETVRIFMEDLDAAVGAYIGELTDLSELLIKETKEEQDAATLFSESIAGMGVAIAAFATIFTLLMSFLISRLITKPINSMKEKIAVFAGGDLTASFESGGRDAVAQMGGELERMAASLRGVMNTIKHAGNKITDSAQDFSAMAEQTSASVEEFRANIDEMSVNLGALASAGATVNASVEEVAAGAQTTAEKGTDIARKVDDAMSAGDTGMSAVRSVVQGIGRVADSSEASMSAVLELGNRTRQIQNFVSQIGSIADQTNLLALNAAIEAARAGDAGRGFAVVAEEVRKLAEDSNIAAKNIADLASQITGDLDKIVEFAQENASDSNNAKDLSAETENAIANMISYLKDIASATQDLAAVAEEQAASSEEIAESIESMSAKVNDTARASENIRTSVSEVAAASEKVAEGSESLSCLSNDLQEELSFFNVGDDAGDAGRKTGLKAINSAR